MDSLVLFLPFLLIMGGFMYFASRRQRRAMQATIDLHESLRPGDRVHTSSGLEATILAITDDTVDLEIAPGVVTTQLSQVPPASSSATVVPASSDSRPATAQPPEPAPQPSEYKPRAPASWRERLPSFCSCLCFLSPCAGRASLVETQLTEQLRELRQFP